MRRVVWMISSLFAFPAENPTFLTMKPTSVAVCAAAAAAVLATSVYTAPLDGTEPQHLTPRYVDGLVAPSGYTYSWVVGGRRMALDAKGDNTYLAHTTISKDSARTTQQNVNDCTSVCEKTVSCTMASVIRFKNYSEGNVICAVYSATAPESKAKYTTGPFWGSGEVQASYTFTRNAGQVKRVSSTTSRAATQTTTTSRASSASATASATSKTTLNTLASSTSARSSTSAAPTPSAVYNQWQFVDVPGTTCADGSSTGMAINLHAGSTDLIIGLQEGGSCYDYKTCYVDKRAYYMDSGFSNSTFWTKNQPSTLNRWFPFARNNQYNPWKTANYAWIPYCTGDFHAGNNVVQYNGVNTHHTGSKNVKLDMAKLKQVLPGVTRVWISGSSAGAFGSILQYQNAQDAFGVRIDLLADSGETPLPITIHPSQKIQTPDTSRCPNCNDSNFDSYIVGLAQANTRARFASLSWSIDNTIPRNQGVSSDDFAKELVRLFAQQTQNTTNARNFMVQGSGHTLLYSTQYNAADGYTMATFLNKFKTDDPAWSSH